MNKYLHCISVSVLFSVTSLLVADEVPPELAACAKEADEARRLACYDAILKSPDVEQPVLATQATAETPTHAATPAASVSSTVPASTAEAADSPSYPAAPELTPDADVGQTDDRPNQDEMSVTVSEVTTQPRGEHVVVLDDGQVWQETTASRYFPVEPGDQITLKKRMFGGYRLVTESGKGFSVKRIR